MKIAASTGNTGLCGSFLDKFPNSLTVTCRDGSIDVTRSEVRHEKSLIFWAFRDFASVWNFTDFPRIIFAGTYLRVLLGDFGESEIVYKIETVELRLEKFRSSAHSILKRGGRRLRCGRGKR